MSWLTLVSVLAASLLVTTSLGHPMQDRVAVGVDTVYVAPPTGKSDIDRANVQIAFDAVRPGSVVQFAAGMYMLGAGARLTVPNVTVLGHPEGTVLRGCDPEAFMIDESAIGKVSFGCTGFFVQAEHQTIRGLTFEYTWHGIVVGPYPTTAEEATSLMESGQLGPPVYPAGGQHIEGNTFRRSPNGLRVLGTGDDVSVVRDNDFIDVFHAIGIYGAPLHFVDNRILVEKPERVPFTTHPGSAVLVSPGNTDCTGHVVAGNRIEGHPDAIYVLVPRGETCHGVEIRDNTIHVARVTLPEAGVFYERTEKDSTMVGAPITLMNNARLSGMPEADTAGVLENVIVHENRVIGGEGVGIVVQDASRNRITGNTITGIQQRIPFPGLTWDGFDQQWKKANGSGIWISPGSHANEISGNTFDDIAAFAVVVEGDSNRLALDNPADAVRDLGTGNRVDRFVDVGGLRFHYIDFGGIGLPILFIHSGSRGAEMWRDFAPRFTDHHRVLAITARGVRDSEGTAGGAITRAGDILALLDTLGIQRAVLIGNSSPAQEMTYLAENRPERLAGLVYLAHAPTAAASLSDPSGGMAMYWRHIAAQMGLGPDSDIFSFRPRYLDREDFRIEVPALTFINQEGTRGLERVPITLLIAEGVRQQGSDFISDPTARAFFERLATDTDLQARVRAAWDEVIRPAELANQKAFERAFGEHMQIVALDVPLRDGVPVVTGYEYRDAPELIEPHIRRFLAGLDVGGDDKREHGSSKDALRGLGTGSQRESRQSAIRPDTIQVAPATGEREADRANVLTALERARPGSVVRFGSGTYLVGGTIPIATSGLTLLGHPEGTTLRGCDPDEASRASADPEAEPGRCAGLLLRGGQQSIRNLIFEHFSWASLTIEGEDGQPNTEGGHVIEGNSFRNSNSFDVISDAEEPIVIRENTFLNTYHAVAIQGRNVHFLDNDISAPEPERIPYGRPDIAIGIAQFSSSGPSCADNLIEGNRIQGHSDGIAIAVFGSGTRCTGNVVRNNVIAIGRVMFAAHERLAMEEGQWPPGEYAADSAAVGVALRLLNLSTVYQPPGGMSAGELPAVLQGNLIEGNRIEAAEWLGIDVIHASHNRIVGNTIKRIARWDLFPTNVMRNLPDLPAEANGSGIWISPGSGANEIADNVFEDVAAYAVVVEGDSNRVALDDPADTVRDTGTQNQVDRFVMADGIRLHYLDFGGEGLPILFTAGPWAAGIWKEFAPQFTDHHRVLALTERGTPPSEGEGGGYVRRANDILAVLDAFGIERVVLIGNNNPAQFLIYIAEHHPDRVAALVFLSPASEAGFENVDDPSKAMYMVERAARSTMGKDPNEAGTWEPEDFYRPRYFEADTATLFIPALTFVALTGTRGMEHSYYPLEIAALVGAGHLTIPDSISQMFFERLAVDEVMQAEVRAAWDSVFAPAMVANERAFVRAFGDHLQVVRLDVPLMNGVPVVTGYEFRDAPELIEPHLRRFLAELRFRYDH